MKSPLALLYLWIISLVLLPAAATGAAEREVLLKPDDTVRIEVYQEADLSSSTRIQKNGEVILPLVGAVKVSGLTLEAARKAITEAYAKDYLVEPKVIVTVDNHSQEFFSVLGAVASPGQFTIPQNGRMDLPTAITLAGGPAPDADPSGVILVRANGGNSTFSTAVAQSNASIQILPGDRVTVRRSNFASKQVHIMGHVNRPGAVPFPVSGQLNLVEATLQAGGVSEMGQPRKVRIVRGENVLEVDLKSMMEGKAPRYALQPGDIVDVLPRLW